MDRVPEWLMLATQELYFAMLLVRLAMALLFLLLLAAPVIHPAPPQTLIAIKTNCQQGRYKHIAVIVRT